MNNDNCDCRADSSGFEFCDLHAQAPELREFVELIARMKTLTEINRSGELYSDDDAVETLDELIVSARKITGMESETPKSDAIEAAAKEQGIEVVRLKPEQTSPVDLRGMPYDEEPVTDEERSNGPKPWRKK